MLESEIEAFVQRELIKKGWFKEDILAEVYLNHDGRRMRPDMILLYNLYPLAIVEVKSQTRHLEDATRQGLLYAEALPEIPFVIATNGRKSKITKIVDGQVSEIQGLPSPQDLWKSLNREWNEDDPRIFSPLRNNNRPLQLHQARAISKSIDNILKGGTRFLISMVTGSGRSQTIIDFIWKLLGSGYSKKALLLTDRWVLAEQMYSLLMEPFQQDVQLVRQLGEIHQPRNLIVSVIHTFFEQSGDLKPLGVPKDFYDLIVIDDLKRVDLLKPLLAYFDKATVVGFTGSPTHVKNLEGILGEPIFIHDLESALSSERFGPPPGFTSKILGEIAGIDSGIMQYKKEKDKVSKKDATSKEFLYLISSREIEKDGTIDFSTAPRQDPDNVQLSKVIKRHGLQLNDIVVNSYFLGRSRIKVGFISELTQEKAIITRSLTRIRVNPNIANPKDVYDFLLSDAGQRVLQMYAQGSTSPQLTVRYLSQIPIFLPLEEDGTSPEKDSLNASSRAIDELENKVLPLLKNLTHQSDVEDTESLLVAQRRLLDISASLLPSQLPEQVLKDFPTPIAFAYQQYKNAQFNIYEKVQRLKDTFEAISFFVYNVLLADFLQNLDQSAYFIENSGTRRAYKHFSMASRISFIAAIQEIAKFNKGKDLFIPEIINFDTEKASSLQSDFRNKAAHTATAPEQAQRELIKTFEPLVNGILAELEFLANYRLVRIPLFYFKQEQLIRRTELYRGVAPIIEEVPVEEKGLLRVDREHLVLVNEEEEVLDLYPLYQLIASERSNYQRHIAFLKQRKFQEQRLEGESVQGAYVVDLAGFDHFENLASKILDSKPGDDK